jgi:chromosome segregation ATPase
MTTKKNENAIPSYVLKVGEDNLRYAHDLLVGNAKLRFLVASLESERLQLIDKLRVADHFMREYEAMKGFLSALEQEKQRLQEQLRQLREEHATQQSQREGLERQLAEIETQNQASPRSTSRLNGATTT